MRKYFLITAVFLLLFWWSFVFAHVGEPVEEHAAETGEHLEEISERAAETRTGIGPIFFGGVLLAGLLGFLVWNVVKK